MKGILSVILTTTTVVLMAQSNQLQNTINYLKSKELDKAKASADAAAVHPDTEKKAKLWMFRGKVYQAI